MDSSSVTVGIRRGRSRTSVDGCRVVFSPHQCFRFDGSDDERTCLGILGDYLLAQTGLVLCGQGPLLTALVEQRPALADHALADHALAVIGKVRAGNILGQLPLFSAEDLPPGTETVFLAETRSYPRLWMRNRLPSEVKVIEPDVLVEIAKDAVPARAWTSIEHNIYPTQIPEIRLQAGLHMVLLDCPARNLALMPNGLGYVHNALKKTAVKFQTFDLDIVAYHRFHMQRLFDEGGAITLADGRILPGDPWQAEHYDLWADASVMDYFAPLIEEAAAALIEAKPKILGLSLQQCNEEFTRRLVEKVKRALPETIIVVGGFSCYSPDIGLRAFPQADYMCIGEADLTIGPLVESLIRGDTPCNLPGVISRHDDPALGFIPGPMPHNLGRLDFPRYEWFGVDIYRNYNDYQLTPIIASRGCRWSRCTFCAERFYWRVRTAEEFVDELEWLIGEGCTLFMFNESDLNGMPERVLEICDEIIRRNIKVKLTGQLRIHKKSNRAFFDKLRAAGMVALRFGVDAFSKNTLRLQKKGYTVDTVSQNLRDCWEAGIFTEVNWVIGVPGETEKDVTEGIELILANQNYIGRLANINPLILSNGSVYWLEPDKHKIRFTRPKDELFRNFPRALPADTWYSDEPFIDAQVRKDRFEKIVVSLHEAGFNVGNWANRIIEDVKFARDRSRSAGTSVPVKTAEDATGATSNDQLDPQRAQSSAGSYLRAASALGDVSEGRAIPRPKVIRVHDQWIAMDEAAYAAAFDQRRPTGTASSAAAPPVVQGPQTGLRRLAFMLPVSIQWKLIRIFKRERARRGTGAALSNSQIIFMILRGAGREVMAAPRLLLGRLLGRQGGAKTPVVDEVAIGDGVFVTGIVAKHASPELMCTVGETNIVRFDGKYFCVPHGTAVLWEDGTAADLPGVRVASTVKEAMSLVSPGSGLAKPAGRESAGLYGDVSGTPFPRQPRKLDALEGYDLIAYEGWYYGIPQSLGEVDLSQVDMMETTGVIRDVSRDVVEGEIFDRAQSRLAVGAE